MDESFKSLQAELAILMESIRLAREAGNDALADLLGQDAARCLMKLADIHTPVPPSEQFATQQQQQIQPDKDEPEVKE